MLALTKERKGVEFTEEERMQNKQTYELICDQLFDTLDKNNDGKVSLTEFIDNYHAQKRYIVE